MRHCTGRQCHVVKPPTGPRVTLAGTIRDDEDGGIATVEEPMVASASKMLDLVAQPLILLHFRSRLDSTNSFTCFSRLSSNIFLRLRRYLSEPILGPRRRAVATSSPSWFGPSSVIIINIEAILIQSINRQGTLSDLAMNELVSGGWRRLSGLVFG